MSSKRKNIPMKYSTSDDEVDHAPVNVCDVTHAPHGDSDSESDRSLSPGRAGSASPGSSDEGRMRSKKQRLLQSLSSDVISGRSNFFHPYERPAPRANNQRTCSVTSDASDASAAVTSHDVRDDVTLMQQLTSSVGGEAGRRMLESVQTMLEGGASVEEKKLKLNSMIQQLQSLQKTLHATDVQAEPQVSVNTSIFSSHIYLSLPSKNDQKLSKITHTRTYFNL